MIQIWCRDQHKSKGLCDECRVLLEYSLKRLDKCPYLSKKPVCAKCTIHCYTTDKRDQIRQIMRYSGPRMFLRYPVLAISHLFDRLKSEPSISNSGKNT